MHQTNTNVKHCLRNFYYSTKPSKPWNCNEHVPYKRVCLCRLSLWDPAPPNPGREPLKECEHHPLKGCRSDAGLRLRVSYRFLVRNKGKYSPHIFLILLRTSKVWFGNLRLGWKLSAHYGSNFLLARCSFLSWN